MKGMLTPICLFESEELTFACNPNINLIVYGKNKEQAINEFRTAFALMMDCCDNLGALDTLIADCSLPIDKFSEQNSLLNCCIYKSYSLTLYCSLGNHRAATD